MLRSPGSTPAGGHEPAGPIDRIAWAARLRQGLQDDVLPWWQREMFDVGGRVLGGRENDGRLREAPRSAVLGTRLLWTFASAQLRLAADAQRAVALQHAFDWVCLPLTDAEQGGLYWHVDAAGRPLATHKQTYAQAFGIYAHTAMHEWLCREAGQPRNRSTPALQQAVKLFELIEQHAYDAIDGGYREGCTRDWLPLPKARLSDAEPVAAKTTNTQLHVLEACTELLRCYPRSRVDARLRELVQIFMDKLWQPRQRCFGLFFARGWQNMTPQVSWGHDIEAAWLLVRACDVLGDRALLQRARSLAIEVADAVLERGMADDGHVFGAGLFDGSVTDRRSHWWCQAEAVVGFWDAWQTGGNARHARAAWRVWQYIERHHVDRQGGDWFKLLDEHGRPLDTTPKAGPWECPYHHVRAGLEMIERLGGGGRDHAR